MNPGGRDNHRAGVAPPAFAIVTLSAVGALALWWSVMPHGIGLGPDSAHYLSASDNLRNGNGFASSIVPWWSTRLSEPIVGWPPGYPAVLAALAFLSPSAAALAVNLTVFALTASLVGAMVHAETTSLFGSLCATLAVLVAPAIVGVHRYAWSEPLFILLFLLCAFGLTRFVITRRSRFVLLAATASAGAALTRYLGGATSIAGLMILVATVRKDTGRLKWQPPLVFGVVAALPVTLWLIRNLLVAHSLTGPRSGSAVGLLESARLSLVTFRDWVTPDALPPLSAWVLLTAILFAVSYVLWNAFHQPPAVPTCLWPLAVVAGIYFAAVLWSTMTVAANPLGPRFLSPLVPLVVVILASLLFAKRDRPFWRDRGRALCAAVMAFAFIVFPALNSTRSVLYGWMRTDGLGYRAARWRESDLMQAAVGGHPPFGTGVRIFSNEPEALFTYTGQPILSVRAPYDDGGRAPAELYRAVIAKASVVALFHEHTAEGPQVDDEALEGSGLFSRAARFATGCVFVARESGE